MIWAGCARRSSASVSGRQPLRGGFEQDRGRLGREPRQHTRQRLLCRGGNELAVGPAPGLGVAAGGLDGQAVQFNARKRFYQVAQLEAEKANPAIHIRQVARAGLPQPRARHFHQFGQQKRIVLKEGIRRHFPALRLDAQHHFETAFGRRMRPHPADLLAQGRLGNEAFLDVHDQAVIGANVANVQALLEFVPLAANHDAVAIAVRPGTGDDRGDPRRVQSPEPLEKVAHLFVLEPKLAG